jgi:hypothetical protein
LVAIFLFCIINPPNLPISGLVELLIFMLAGPCYLSKAPKLDMAGLLFSDDTGCPAMSLLRS